MRDNEFNNTTKKVISFFSTFNTTFNADDGGIDDLFDRIDAAGGVKDDLLLSLLNKLKRFHDSIYKDCSLESSKNSFFDSIELSKKSSLDEIISGLSIMQNGLQNYFSHDDIWPGQTKCVDLISNALTSTIELLNRPQNETEKYKIYRIAHIFCELIADCSISICGIIPLAKWNVGSNYFACLSAENQLLALLNKAILLDRMYICVYTLKEIV